MLSLSCRFNQHGTCFKIKCRPLVTANGSVSASSLSTASHLLRPPKLARSKLATFHKQFHQLVTQLDVYWKMTDFPGASRVPALGDGALARIIDHNYDLILVSFATLFMETFHWGFLLLFILIWSQACLLNLRPLLFALHLPPFHCQQPICCITSFLAP